MYDAIMAHDLTMAWRDTDTPFDARCRAIEPVIDACLAQHPHISESDTLGQGRRLVQTAGLQGVLGPYFGQHVVRRVVGVLGEVSPRFHTARQLVEQLCLWPVADAPGRSAAAKTPVGASCGDRQRDEWAVVLAARLNSARLQRLAERWQAILAKLVPQTAPGDDAVVPPDEDDKALSVEQLTRLKAIAQLWTQSFGDTLGDAAPYLRPPPEMPPQSASAKAWAQRTLATWRHVDVALAAPAPRPRWTPVAQAQQGALRLWQGLRGPRGQMQPEKPALGPGARCPLTQGKPVH